MYGPDGAQMAASGSSSVSDRDGEVSVQALSSGTFTVVTSAYRVSGSVAGDAAHGAYILSLVQTPGAITVAAGDSGGPLINGDQQSGTIDVGELDVWSFTANAGDSIVVRM